METLSGCYLSLIFIIFIACTILMKQLKKLCVKVSLQIKLLLVVSLRVVSIKFHAEAAESKQRARSFESAGNYSKNT